ncbi:hypothetical protein [Leucobacter salsicius]|uniref:hypothetical protein n=1 Tax=Leucobacter salsicius TaxID=664638 RepID=UPI00034BFABC|nr:hypothetical protein [Leucobacter salsicius]
MGEVVEFTPSTGLSLVEETEFVREVIEQNFSQALGENKRHAEQLLGPMEPMAVSINLDDPEGHGVFGLIPRENSEPRRVMLADYVPYIESRDQLCSPNADGELEPVESALTNSRVRLCTVAVVDSSGRKWVAPNLPQSKAEDIKEALKAVGGPFRVPAVSGGPRHMSNVLISAQQEYRQELISTNRTGWIKLEGRHVYALPGGSLDARGTTDAVRVANAGTGGGAPVAYQAALGLPEVGNTAGEAQGIAEALRALRAIATDRIMVPMIGATLASVIPQSEGAGMILTAKRGSGKSSVLRAVRSLFSAAPVASSGYALSLTADNSAPAVNAVLSWHGHVGLFIDDYRVANVTKLDDKANEGATIVAQAAYGDGGRAKSDITFSVQQADSRIVSPIMTGEISPGENGEAIRSRIAQIAMDMARGEIYGLGKSDSPLHALQPIIDRTDGLRKLTAALVQYLASKLDADGIPATRTRFASLKLTRQDSAAGLIEDIENLRVAQVCSVWTLGWDLLREMVGAHAGTPLGDELAPLLPSEQQITEIYHAMVRENVVSLTSGSISTRLLDEISAMIGAGKGHLLMPARIEGVSGQDARSLWKRYGWRESPVKEALDPKGLSLGVLSDDGKLVHILAGTIGTAAKSDSLKLGMGADQLAEIMHSVEHPDYRGAKPGRHKGSRKVFTDTRPASGFTIPAALLGLDPSLYGDDELETTGAIGENEK